MAFMSPKQNKQANHESAKNNRSIPGGAGSPWERRCKQKQHTKQNKSTGGGRGGVQPFQMESEKKQKRTVTYVQ